MDFLQNLVVGLIIFVAAFYLLKSVNRKKKGGGCGDCGGCDSCCGDKKEGLTIITEKKTNEDDTDA